MAVLVRSYTSPTLVLLAYDWAEGQQRTVRWLSSYVASAVESI